MSVALQFSLTVAGQAVAWNAKKTGVTLDLTHIQMGSGNRAPNGLEVVLVQPQEVAAIAGGSQITPGQVRMSALFSSMLGYEIREIGLWAGNPANPGSVLVGYWSQAAGVLATKAPGVDFIFSHDMVLDGAVPADSLNVLADTSQAPLLAMIAAHEAKADPHPSYASKAGIQVQSYTGFATAGAAPAFTLAVDPPVTQLKAGLRFRVKFSAAGGGSNTLAINGLGAKSIKQFDASGNKIPAVIAANQLSDVEYDGADFVLLAPLPDNLAGAVIFHAGAAAPTGYLKANGAAVSRLVYATLFGVIGTSFGAGDGATTFNLPDLRGEFLRGWDNGRGIDSARVLGSWQSGSPVAHDDDGGMNNYTPAGLSIFRRGATGLADFWVGAFPEAYWSAAGGAIASAASVGFISMARPRNIALLACIKY